MLIGSSGDPGARLAVYGDNAAQAVLMVRAAASQSAWLQEWQDSAGTNVAGMDAAGNLTVTKLTTSAGGIPAGDQTISGNLHVTGQTYSTGLINSTYGYVTGGAVGITRTINYMNSAGQPQTLQFTGGILTGAT